MFDHFARLDQNWCALIKCTVFVYRVKAVWCYSCQNLLSVSKKNHLHHLYLIIIDVAGVLKNTVTESDVDCSILAIACIYCVNKKPKKVTVPIPRTKKEKKNSLMSVLRYKKTIIVIRCIYQCVTSLISRANISTYLG